MISVSVTQHALDRFAQRCLGIPRLPTRHAGYIRHAMSLEIAQALTTQPEHHGQWSLPVRLQYLGREYKCTLRIKSEKRPTVVTVIVP